MLFTSPFFIFCFFPFVFILHWILPQRMRNAVILLSSLFFYAYGEKSLVAFLILSIIVNYILAKILSRNSCQNKSRLSSTIVLWLGIAFNIGLLAYFKYANFFVIEILSVDPSQWKNIVLPIGISFYTFQCLSYLIDVYYGKTLPAKSVVTFGAYISCFPQLIAGPIVRYEEIQTDLCERHISFNDMYAGLQRFIIGFGKKMLIANPMGWVADQVYAMPMHCLDAPHAWLGMICYTLQIYYDFSGYSDMAIGLGRMLGFHFPENFNFPYIASSIRDFWRRWHMTLTRLLRDYVYIPLGGSRGSYLRTSFNKWTVFILCGFWHGAAWSFLVWGLWHGFFIVLEGALQKKLPITVPKVFKHAYTLLIVSLGWVIFRSETLEQAGAMLKAAFCLASPEPWAYTLARLARPDMFLIMGAGIVGSMPIFTFIRGRLPEKYRLLYNICGDMALILVFIASCAWTVSSRFNPFLYFRF